MKKHAKDRTPPKMATKKSSALIHQPAENGPVESQVSIPPSACLLKLIKFSESQGGKSCKRGERSTVKEPATQDSLKKTTLKKKNPEEDLVASRW